MNKYLRQLVRKIFRKPTANEILAKKGLLVVGRGTYGFVNIERYEGSDAKVQIGNYCSISKGVRFITGGNHPPDWVSTYPFRIRFKKPGAYKDGLPATNGPILVGHDVWIGTDALILSGVRIGSGAIVSAGAIVTKDVAPYAIVGGVPAKTIRKRFEQSEIDVLLEIAWWDWSDEKILSMVNLLSSNNIKDFITAARINHPT